MTPLVTASTYAVIAESSLYDALSLILAVTLLVLLIYKEILIFSRHPNLVTSRRALNIIITPLLVGFLMIALVSLANI
jgi:hypothetical protein